MKCLALHQAEHFGTSLPFVPTCDLGSRWSSFQRGPAERNISESNKSGRFVCYSHSWLQHLSTCGRMLTFSSVTQWWQNWLLALRDLCQHLVTPGSASQDCKMEGKHSSPHLLKLCPYWKGWQMCGTGVKEKEGDTGSCRHLTPSFW